MTPSPAGPPTRGGRLAARNPRIAVAALLLLSGIITFSALRYVANHRALVRVGYRLSESTAELRRLKEQNRKLRLELSVLTHPDRIERLAEQLGLMRPAPGQVREVNIQAVASAAATAATASRRSAHAEGAP